MRLIFINELGPNYKGENMYEFIFGEQTDELWGEDWDSSPAHGKPGPPEMVYIQSVGTLQRSEVKLELIQNSDYFGMEDALDDIVALGWEVFSDDDLINKEKLVFHFGEEKNSVEDKLYSRDLILKYDKTFKDAKEKKTINR